MDVRLLYEESKIRRTVPSKKKPIKSKRKFDSSDSSPQTPKISKSLDLRSPQQPLPPIAQNAQISASNNDLDLAQYQGNVTFEEPVQRLTKQEERRRRKSELLLKKRMPEHDIDTLNCIAVDFQPWYVSTTGLTRPSTPEAVDIPRFNSLAQNAIDPSTVGPLDNAWLEHILKLVPERLKSKANSLEREIDEAKEIYNKAIRVGQLQYILLDKQEQHRLGVVLPIKQTKSAGRFFYPWSHVIATLKTGIFAELPILQPIMQAIQMHTFEKYASFRFIDFPTLIEKMPMELEEFVNAVNGQIDEAVHQLDNNWVAECCLIVHEHRDEIEKTMPQKIDSRQAKMEKVFATVAALMGRLLRNFVSQTLNDLVEWAEQYSTGNDYDGVFDVFAAKFQPTQPVPLVLFLVLVLFFFEI